MGERLRVQWGARLTVLLYASGVPYSIDGPSLVRFGQASLETRPAFRWPAVEPGLEYQFTLRDASDNTVLARRVHEPVVDLATDIGLLPGQAYRWTVSAKTAAGVSYASTYRFAVADRGRAEQVENFRPGDDAPLAEQVAFTVWLGQMGFADDAARLRERLSAGGVIWADTAHDRN